MPLDLRSIRKPVSNVLLSIHWSDADVSEKAMTERPDGAVRMQFAVIVFEYVELISADLDRTRKEYVIPD